MAIAQKDQICVNIHNESIAFFLHTSLEPLIFLYFQNIDSLRCNTGTELDTICKYDLIKKVVDTFGFGIFGINGDELKLIDDKKTDNSRLEANAETLLLSKNRSEEDAANKKEKAHHRSKRTLNSTCVRTCVACFLLGEHRAMKPCMTACIAGITITCPGALE